MVILPNNHRRVVHMRMLGWFFTESTDSQKAFCPLPLELANHSQALLQYLSDREMFKNEEYISPTPYIFTVNDIRFLLINRFNLTALNYLVRDVQYNDYEKLYNIAYVNQLPLTGLHGLQVDFSQKDTLHYLDDLVDGFISEKTPLFFKHVVIELSKLNSIAKNPKYHDFFSHNDLHLTVSYYNEDKRIQHNCTIDTQKFHDAMASFSSNTLSSSRFFQNKSAVMDLIRHLYTDILGIENPLSPDLSKGELLLAALVCTFHARHNPISQLFWETQNAKEPAAKEQPCRESDIDLLSKIRNH